MQRSLPSSGAWIGKPAILVGGGPSLKGFDWSILIDVPRVVVINRAFMDVPTADIFITEDERFITRFAPQLREFAGVKVFASPDDAYVPRVREAVPEIVIARSRTKEFGWSECIEDGLSISSNSAIPALNLIDILGGSPIYLLGFDCRMEGATISNYHADYPSDWAVNAGQLDSFRSDFENWASIHLRIRACEVVNVVNPACESAISCWPKISHSEFANLLTAS